MGGPKNSNLANALCTFASRLGLKGCYYPNCGSTKQSNLIAHVTSHSSRALVECALCGRKVAGQLYGHFQKEHPGEKMKTKDLRASTPGLEEYLVEIVYKCYPQLRDSALVLDTRNRCPRLAAALDSLVKGQDSLSCSVPECGVPVANSSLALEVHALGHWSGPPVFQCNNCRFSGHDIIQHALRTHRAVFSQDGLRIYEDGRPGMEDGLLSNLDRCFPFDEDSVMFPAQQPRSSLPLRSTSQESSHQRTINSENAHFSINQTHCSMDQSSVNSRYNSGPIAKRLLAYCNILRLGWKSGFYKLDKCRFPGCSLVLNPANVPTPLQHLVVHVKKPTEECGLCGFRKRGNIDSHFRSTHPDVSGKIPAVDIRYLIEDELVVALKTCYPGLDSALLFARATVTEQESLPTRWLQAIESAVRGKGLKCCWEGCESPGLEGISSLALESHILSHHHKPAFRCLSCRYEGPDMFGHCTEVHMRKGGVSSVFKYEDDRTEMEDDLLNLLSQCLPGVDLSEKADEEELEEPEPPSAPPPTQKELIRQKVGGSRRAVIGDVQKPWRYLWLMRALFGYRSWTGKGIQCSLCSLTIAKDGRPDAHPYGHVTTYLYICKLCGFKAKHRGGSGAKNHGHGEPEHDRLGAMAMEDLRWEKDAELIVAALRCFPVLAQLRLWFQNSTEMAFARCLVARCAERSELRCSLPDCAFSLSSADTGAINEVDAQRHLLEHFDTPVFHCHQCRFAGQDIWAHIQERHSNFRRRPNTDLPFDDYRLHHDPGLLQLLERVFP